MKPTMINRSLLRSVFLLAIIFISFNGKAQTATDDFNKALDNFYAGDFEQSLVYFNSAIKKDPQYSDAYRERAYTYIVLKRMDEALVDLNKALSLKSPDYRANYGRGLVYESKKDNRAINEYELSKGDASYFVDAYNRIGLILCEQGKYDAAISYYMQAIKHDPMNNTPCLMINMIEPLLRLKNFKMALQYIDENSTAQKQNAISSYTNTLNLKDKASKTASWQFFRTTIKPSIEQLSKGDYTAAITSLSNCEAEFKVGAESDPDYQKQSYSLLLSLKGYACEKSNNIAGAIKAYEQSLVIQPVQPEAQQALNDLILKQAIALKKDTAKPVITLLEPAGNNRSISVGTDKVASTLQHLRGTVTDDNGLRSVLLNNTPLAIAANGYFDTTVNLQPGFNSFVVVATDNNANTIVSPITINATPSADGNNQNNNSIPIKPVYHAVLIAENDYQDKNIPSLHKPASDLKLIYNTLVNDYTFDPANIDTLINASRTDILTALTQKGEALKEGESLFIFYAGHGDLKKNPDNSEESFLLPKDAVNGKTFTYINGEEFLKSFRFTKAKHILVVADACFAGSLFRGLGKSGNQSLSEKYKDISRRLLSSGNVKVVPDNSEFIPFFLNALKNNKSSLITAEKLVDGFKEQYNLKANQQLQFLPIDYLNDQGGQFVFERKQ